MATMLFARDLRAPKARSIRTSGAHIKIRDYFVHALHHPTLEPRIYFTSRSDVDSSDVWAGTPRDLLVDDASGPYDFAFVTGKDWKLIPKVSGMRVVHLVQSIQQCQPNHKMYPLFEREAMRICVSPEVAAAVRPLVTHKPVVIPNGIPTDLFRPGNKVVGSVFIWGVHNPVLACAIHQALDSRGVNATVLLNYIPRVAFAERLGSADIVVTIPQGSEGFFLPALEAMACGAALVCPDAGGNRSFCVDGETCLMPSSGDVHSYLGAVEQLRHDRRLADRIRKEARAVSSRFSLDAERKLFHRFVDECLLAGVSA
jgi:glycosyltransferase involved in cell wall biosynthesis